MNATGTFAVFALTALLSAVAVGLPTDIRSCSPRERLTRMTFAVTLAFITTGLTIGACVSAN